MNVPAKPRHIDTLLLLGPPASGKSMIGRYLAGAGAELAGVGIDVGPIVRLDDFHYVRFMWRISELMQGSGHGPVFLESDGLLFNDPLEWGTLIHLLNEDHAALLDEDDAAPGTSAPRSESPGEWIIRRLERAHVMAGMDPPFQGLDPAVRRAVVAGIGDEAAAFAAEHTPRRHLPGSTVMIEFSRGGPAGAALPLRSPYGNAHALSLLSPAILRSAVILYVHVSPEESRRRNRQRAEPSAGGTTLRHAVPESVMKAYYGTDDMPRLMAYSERPGTISVRAHGQVFSLPTVRFDNEDQRMGVHLPGEGEPEREAVERIAAGLHDAFAGSATAVPPPTRASRRR